MRRPVLTAALAALPVLAVLLGLGTWQLQRLTWKTALLERMAAAEAAPPVALGPAPEPYAKVVVAGRFDHAREALLGAEVRGTSLGAHLIVPLLREDGQPPLLVDRGWVPVERRDVLARPEGRVEVTGYVRAAEARSSLAAADDAPGRRFYTFDPAAIGRALGLPAVAPFGLVALAPPGAEQPVPPVAARGMPRPNNPHLGYAITWFGLAATLVGVVLAFALTRRKEPPAP